VDDADQDPIEALHLDGNAVAGALHDWFGEDMTAAPGQCASCGNVAPMATLLAFTQAPGVVLRCSLCMAVVVRMVETRDASYLDARGAAWLRRPRQNP
jgi:Family of unknown function (DUF6510)